MVLSFLKGCGVGLTLFCLSLPSMLLNANLDGTTSDKGSFLEAHSNSKQKTLAAPLSVTTQPFIKGTITSKDASNTQKLSEERTIQEELKAKKSLPNNSLKDASTPQDIFHRKIPHNPIPRNPLPRNRIPDNKLERNRIPANKLPQNKIPKNALPRNSIPSNPIPKNSVPKNPLPQDRTPATSAPLEIQK